MMNQSELGVYFWGVYIWFAVGFFLIAVPAIIEIIKIFSGGKRTIAEITKAKENT